MFPRTLSSYVRNCMFTYNVRIEKKNKWRYPGKSHNHEAQPYRGTERWKDAEQNTVDSRYLELAYLE